MVKFLKPYSYNLFFTCWVIFACLFVVCWFFYSKKKSGIIYHQCIKQLGYWSGPTKCRTWSASKLFAKVINSLWQVIIYIQSNFGRSNSPVSNTKGRSNMFIGPGNSPLHLMLKYTSGSNSDGSNSRTQSTVRRAIFHVKTLWWLEPNISKTWICHTLDLSSLLFS